jgi:hypothetical protein
MNVAALANVPVNRSAPFKRSPKEITMPAYVLEATRFANPIDRDQFRVILFVRDANPGESPDQFLRIEQILEADYFSTAFDVMRAQYDLTDAVARDADGNEHVPDVLSLAETLEAVMTFNNDAI